MNTPLSPRDAELTSRLVAAWLGGEPLSADDAARLAPLDDQAACAVQDAVGAALGWFPQGRARAWKIASVPPTAAPIPDAFILEGALQLKPAHFHTLIGIEVELVLRLGRALAANCTASDAKQAIDGVFAAIEVFDVRARDWPTLPRTFLLADQQMHGRLLVGSGITEGWNDDLAETEMLLTVDNIEKLRRHGGHALGSPLAILPWLAGHVAARGDGLQAGDLIASGTWSGLYQAQPGDRITARFAGIGEVCVDIAKS